MATTYVDRGRSARVRCRSGLAPPAFPASSCCCSTELCKLTDPAPESLTLVATGRPTDDDIDGRLCVGGGRICEVGLARRARVRTGSAEAQDGLRPGSETTPYRLRSAVLSWRSIAVRLWESAAGRAAKVDMGGSRSSIWSAGTRGCHGRRRSDRPGRRPSYGSRVFVSPRGHPRRRLGPTRWQRLSKPSTTVLPVQPSDAWRSLGA
jgi:hypothetical protein